MHLSSLIEGKQYLKYLWRRNESIGSVHTLGALHKGHGVLIRLSSQENKHTVVTIYPNKIQLFPGLIYKHDLERDVKFAFEHGANVVITSHNHEMFPERYRTYINQGESHSKLNSSIFPFAAKGQVTGTIRWLNYTRSHRSYFGLKDIEQAILVKRAVKDLLIECEIKYVPCIRYKNGVPISSRLRFLDETLLLEVGGLYEALEYGRQQIAIGQNQPDKIIEIITRKLSKCLNKFKLLYLTLVDSVDFNQLNQIELPFIIHAAIQYQDLVHFDGIYIKNEKELQCGTPVIWLD